MCIAIRLTIALTIAAGVAACDESLPESAAAPTTPVTPAAPPANTTAPKRPTLLPDNANSALGKAKGAGQRTVDRSDAYQDRLLREMEDDE